MEKYLNLAGLEKVLSNLKKTFSPKNHKHNVTEISGLPDIVDSLQSEDNTKILSAKQGKVLNDKIDNISVGGRNLLLESSVHKTSNEYLIAHYDFGSEKPIENEECTVTLKGNLGLDRDSFRVFNSGGNVLFGCLKHKGNGIYSYTGKWIISYDSYTASNTYINVYQFHENGETTSEIEWIKFERGNRVTDWTPAQEDIVSKLNETTTELSSNILKTVGSNYLPVTGGDINGVIKFPYEMVTVDDSDSGAIHMNNCDIAGLNSLKFYDVINTTSNGELKNGKGIHFYRDETHTDSFWGYNGDLYFAPNRVYGEEGTGYKILNSNNYNNWAAKKEHIHDYLSLSGGTLTGKLSVTNGCEVEGNLSVTKNNGGCNLVYNDTNKCLEFVFF